MRPTMLLLLLAACSSSTASGSPGDGGSPDDAGRSLFDQLGYPCGAVTTYPFDGGDLDAGDDGGFSYAQCQTLCAGAPGGANVCYLGDAGATLVCQAPGCG